MSFLDMHDFSLSTHRVSRYQYKFLFHCETVYLCASKTSKIRCDMHPNADCATTADSPGCKLGKAITAASVDSQLTLGDRVNNLHILCVALVCRQISIRKKNTAPWQAKWWVSALHSHCLSGLHAGNRSLIDQSRQQVFIYVQDEPSHNLRA